ncbi:myomegalin isoform X2 [Denticeps clupeoides]|uniref:myomegalin isoform X2 n=1 Tax=Denticeps clupeoides TaxID=299321 RepID=UPI0010A48D7E|nr:myomegalin isoform X2 [Denticeps clupeoides]
MKEACRICARELCGNQRRWIFHPAAKLNLQVLLSHALGRELTRDGRGEFACGKCAFMLDRMYRFDTVIARVEALSVERLQRLLQEKDRLRQCIAGLYRKHNGDELPNGAAQLSGKDCTVDMSGLHHAKYCALLQEDLVYSVYESWAEEEEQTLAECAHHQCHHAPSELSAGHRPRQRCRGCSALRVADSDYEAVCRVPRKLARSTSCGPSTRYSSASGAGSVSGEEREEERTSSTTTLKVDSQPADAELTSDSERTLLGRGSSSPSMESLDTAVDAPHSPVQTGESEGDGDVRDDGNSDSLSEERVRVSAPASKMALALCLLQTCSYHPVQIQLGSRLPVLVRPNPRKTGIKMVSPERALRTTVCVGGDCELTEVEPPPPCVQLDFGQDMVELEEMWHDDYVEYMPFRFQKSLIEEQQAQLNQYECAAGQCVSELQKAQLQVQSLQAKIHETEANNKKLQEKLSEMECELRSIRQAAQNQERTIQGLNESVTTKDNEAQELYKLIEGQNATLCKLREIAHRNQLQQMQSPDGGSNGGGVTQLQAELVALQGSLFSVQLELEASQRAHRQSQRQAEDQSRAAQRLNNDLQEALQHREATEKHSQDLRNVLQQSRSELQMKDTQLKDMEADKLSVLQQRDNTITQLRLSLQDKDRLLQEYSEMLDPPADSGRPRDALLDKLRSRIRDRDRALERSIDEKFQCLEEKEEETRRLHQALREKERDLERLRTILTNNEETITSLDALVRGKELELEHTQESCRKVQSLKQESEEKHTLILRERDHLITQLQTALHTHSKETEDLRAALLSKVCVSPSEVVEELKARLQLKEHLLQELLSDRSRQAQEHQALTHNLISTISSRDQYIKDSADRLGQVICERTGQAQELRRQLLSRERELGELSREREKERENVAPITREMERLQKLLKEKEAFIQELMQGQEETTGNSRTDSREENRALRDELQLALKKLIDDQAELTSLRSALASKQELLGGASQNLSSPSCQNVLEHVVSEYNTLNEALRAEKKLYQNLTQVQTSGDSAEKTRVLHTELDTVHALRGQLEEVLTRTRNTAMALERANKTQADFGELRRMEEEAEDDEEGAGSSDEFTDSIEDEDVKLNDQSLSVTQTAGVPGGVGSSSVDRWKSDVQHLLEQKRAVERELAELKDLLKRAGFSSLSQMRSTVLSLPRKNKESGGQTGSAGGRGGTEMCRGWEQSDTEEEEEEDEPLSQNKRRKSCHTPEKEEVGEEGEESDDEEEEEDEVDNTVGPPQGKRGPPSFKMRESTGKRKCTQPHSLDLGTLLSHQPCNISTVQEERGNLGEQGGQRGPGRGFWEPVEAGLREQVEGLRSDLAMSRQESRELQERLMVSEATVHAQAEQLKDYRELLTEASVQQDSKLVQVDLQDLGYETSGRSENEAEREESSSPEFDDLEMCTSLSHGADDTSTWWTVGDPKNEEDGGTLVRDLRAELSRSHRVIRTLQLRVRSLSTTSDYASSLERPTRKVNWAFQPSPGQEEDEGWLSDATPRASREMKELVARVASLENQLKSCRMEGKCGGEEGKCATWPGKYNTLIQAQARELSHLRQRMREGRGVCHILTQHLGDTTKAFEELLRANDIDYYMGQSFREQLAQSSSLAQRVSAKISDRDRSELPDDKIGHELLALRLSKELQYKDKIIESLHTKLQQCPETPSSCHAPSETTDQSDRTSFVSDERCSTNEELELCSDMDAGSEFVQEERSCLLKSGTERPSSLPLHKSPSTPLMTVGRQAHPDTFSGLLSSSLPASHNILWPDLSAHQHVPSQPCPRSYSSCELYQKPQRSLSGNFLAAHAKAVSNYPLNTYAMKSPSGYGLLSHDALRQPLLGTRSEMSILKTENSLVESSELWDVEKIMQPVRGFNGPSGYQSGNSHTGVDLIEEHLREIRSLRQHLEDTIRTNDRLRQQLEDRLADTGRDGVAPTNIYIQGLDSVTQLSNEIRNLKEENLGLKSRLQASRESNEEVLCGRARLQQAELEAEQWKEELRRLQSHSSEQSQQIQQLRQDRQASQELSNRLQHEVSLLQQQLCESRQLLHSLQCELQVYDRVCSNPKATPSEYLSGVKCPGRGLPSVELAELLAEVRGLRSQLEHSVQENSALRCQLQKHLEQQLAGRVVQSEPRMSLMPASPLREGIYRRQLLHDPAPSPPVRDMGLFPAGPPYSPFTELDETPLTTNDCLDPHADLEGEAPDGSFASRNGRHAVGHVDDFSALQQQVLEGIGLVQRMEAALQSCLNVALLEVNAGKALDYGCVKSLLSDTKTLRQILEEAMSLLKMFWRAALPSTDITSQQLQKDQTMQEEIHSLRLRVSEQEEVLQGTIQRLKSTNRTKENMELFIVSQLSRTRDVLKKARTNLEKNQLRISSLSSSSSSLCHGKASKGACEKCPDWSVLNPSASAVTMATVNQRPAKKRGRECLLQVVSC